jgi:hypothetical protein
MRLHSSGCESADVATASTQRMATAKHGQRAEVPLVEMAAVM